MNNKRNYWFKFGRVFLQDRRIRKMKKAFPGMREVYYDMLSSVLETDGYMELYPGENIINAMALEIDEDEQRVKETLKFLEENGLMEKIDEATYFFPQTVEYTGSETASARRMRKHRAGKREQEEEENNKASHCDTDVTSSDTDVTKCDTEKEIDIELELEKELDIDTELEREEEIETELEKEEEEEKEKNKEGAKTSRFRPPCLEEVEDYCRERGNSVDAEAFMDFYASKNWMVGKNKMSDWKAAVRTWEKRDNGRAVEQYKKQNNAREEVMNWLAWSKANEGNNCFDWVGCEEGEE